jgi:hypothetical protein
LQPKLFCNTYFKAQVGHNMFAIPTQVFKSNQWQLRSSLRQPCCTWGCSNKNKASISFRSTYTLDFNNSSFIMSASENYETTFNHFLLHFLSYLCNFCPNTCSQEAILMKVSHLGVVTLYHTGIPAIPQQTLDLSLFLYNISTSSIPQWGHCFDPTKWIMSSSTALHRSDPDATLHEQVTAVEVIQ